jgi:hypothetical protein
VSGGIVALIAVISFIAHQLRPRIKAAQQFWDHLVGVDANIVSGQERIPGLFEQIRDLKALSQQFEERLEERLDQQDGVLAAQDRVLETIRHEVEFNNGSSVKDAVVRVEKKLHEHLLSTPAAVINVNPGSAS